jgi:hypothetical protein
MRTPGLTPMNRKKAKPSTGGKITPGPKPEVLKIDGDWQNAIKESLEKKKPPEGWPK